MDKAMLDYNIRVRLPILLLVALTTYFTTFFYSFDERNHVGYTPEQPIKFSHKLHAGEMSIDCRYCHVGADKSRHATVPSVDTCMNCHSVVKKDNPEIQKLTSYFNENKPLPWARVHRVADYVYFNHSIHINKGLDCTECHGNVREMEVVTHAKSLTMGTCLACHRKAHDEIKDKEVVKQIQGPQHCVACHR
ncbi:cytochrome c3 family protein [bacterium]|jgi:hypothetical protein|nr:cytochrome c3 family protein [bacterium]